MDRQNPDAAVSTDTFISLQNIDPVPMPDSRPGSISIPRAEAPPPPSRSSTFASSLGLSGNHGSVWYRT